MPRTLRAAATFWALCLLLAALEARIGANWLGGVLFFLALPTLVGYLAWVHRALLHSALPAPLPLLLYAGTVMTAAIVILALGLLSGQYLFGATTGSAATAYSARPGV